MIDPNASDLVVGVVGCGAMGQGIVQVALQGGLKVVAYDVREGGAAAGRDAVLGRLDRLVEKGSLTAEAVAGMRGALTVTDDIAGLAPAGVVIEAVFEDLEVKRALFAQLDAVVSPDTLLASNTSSLPIGSIARGLAHPGRVG
ncbi:MAG TPA: 3-hydroxyacyl-CoA dehydrogenase NAD-binding domain-containing protein, partial [Kiloniellaceae bacterium]